MTQRYWSGCADLNGFWDERQRNEHGKTCSTCSAVYKRKQKHKAEVLLQAIERTYGRY